MRPGSRNDGVKVVSQVKVAGDVEDELDCEVVREVVPQMMRKWSMEDCEDERELVEEAVLALLEVLELLALFGTLCSWKSWKK